ncbi:hypothetical protein IQ07DRAFT_593004 [Pyrenochaeta sp. DS3sAY3a]|nr:hypothetical protein IQ07DRAFT_593004 [Pyrenochaeta sp. DS3sAY3a]
MLSTAMVSVVLAPFGQVLVPLEFAMADYSLLVWASTGRPRVGVPRALGWRYGRELAPPHAFMRDPPQPTAKT